MEAVVLFRNLQASTMHYTCISTGARAKAESKYRSMLPSRAYTIVGWWSWFNPLLEKSQRLFLPQQQDTVELPEINVQCSSGNFLERWSTAAADMERRSEDVKSYLQSSVVKVGSLQLLCLHSLLVHLPTHDIKPSCPPLVRPGLQLALLILPTTAGEKINILGLGWG